MTHLHRRFSVRTAIVAAAVFTSFEAHAAEPVTALSVVPLPVSMEGRAGAMNLTRETRIVAASQDLEPLAKVLAEEIRLLCGLVLQPARGAGRDGDIVLAIDPKLAEEAYTLDIGKQAGVRGGRYAAVAMGTATLLQLLTAAEGSAALPGVHIEDKPAFGYRGLMVDVARKPHSIEMLEQLVQLCRLYKVRYLHMHLTDGEAWTFPSAAFPKLGTSNWHDVPRYPLEDLKALVRYADDRGVTLIPELETPGHSGAATRDMPELFGSIDENGKPRGLNCMNMGNEKLYEALDTLIGEIAAVFASSPYVHIGCDEVWLEAVSKTPEAAEYMKRHKLANGREMYHFHINRLNELVKKQGKQTVVWEGFHNDGSQNVKIAKDVIVMSFENSYNTASTLIGHGFKVINTGWSPLYVVDWKRANPRYIYDWNAYWFGRFADKGFDNISWVKVEPTPQVLGAQLCEWELKEEMAIPGARKRLPAMSERVWNPDAGRSYADFETRWAATDRVYTRLVHPVRLKTEGLWRPEPNPAENEVPRVDHRLFENTLTVSMEPIRPLRAGEQIHYTIDGTEPLATSAVYQTALTIGRADCKPYNRDPVPYPELVTVQARLFHDGKPVGYKARQQYRFDTINLLPKKVRYQLYEVPPGASAASGTDELKLIDEGLAPWTDLSKLPRLNKPTPYVIVFQGQVEVPEEGDYAFQLHSHQGTSQLFFDGVLAVDRNKTDWGKTEGRFRLTAGKHTMKFMYAGAHVYAGASYKLGDQKDWKSVDSWLTTIEPAQ